MFNKIFFVVSLIGLLGSCATKKMEQPSPEKLAEIEKIGEEVSTDLMKTLKNALVTEIQGEEGFVGAMKVCNVKALKLTDEIDKKHGDKISVKRTSLRVRNPENSPDELETQALEFFRKSMIGNKELAKNYVQPTSEGFRYYKPLKMNSLCLTCHGDSKNMNPEIVAELTKLYPNDKAIGYAEGDFRGLIRVEINEN